MSKLVGGMEMCVIVERLMDLLCLCLVIEVGGVGGWGGMEGRDDSGGGGGGSRVR